MSTSTTTVAAPPDIYKFPPPGDPTYRPLHLFTPANLPYDPRADPVYRLPTPQVLPPLPLITDYDTYRRVFALPNIDIEGQDRHKLQVWGDEVFEWMIQTTLHVNYGMIVRREFNGHYEELLTNNIVNPEQARYFATLYDFGTRLRRHNCNTLTDVEIQKYLPDTFYAYVGAVEKTRGKRIALKWLRDLARPILEYRVDDITRAWPSKVLTAAQTRWNYDISCGYLHQDFKIEELEYEIEDFEWMGENWRSWEDIAEEIMDGMLKNMRRHLRAYAGASPDGEKLSMFCEWEWHPEDQLWSYIIYFPSKPGCYYVGVHAVRRVAEWRAVWRAMDEVTSPKSEMFTYATWF
ncbi:hypothetical protein TWF281_007037 [Arthrobotrys megalospora]